MIMRHIGIMTAILAVLSVIGCDTPVVSLSSPPITVETETLGTGREVQAGDMVVIDYRILLPNGDQVMQGSNYRFMVGQGAVISGIDETVMGMKRGGRRIVNCPPHLHWGRNGYADKIPENTTLTLDVRLRSVQ